MASSVYTIAFQNEIKNIIERLYEERYQESYLDNYQELEDNLHLKIRDYNSTFKNLNAKYINITNELILQFNLLDFTDKGKLLSQLPNLIDKIKEYGILKQKLRSINNKFVTEISRICNDIQDNFEIDDPLDIETIIENLSDRPPLNIKISGKNEKVTLEEFIRYLKRKNLNLEDFISQVMDDVNMEIFKKKSRDLYSTCTDFTNKLKKDIKDNILQNLIEEKESELLSLINITINEISKLNLQDRDIFKTLVNWINKVFDLNIEIQLVYDSQNDEYIARILSNSGNKSALLNIAREINYQGKNLYDKSAEEIENLLINFLNI